MLVISFQRWPLLCCPFSNAIQKTLFEIILRTSWKMASEGNISWGPCQISKYKQRLDNKIKHIF